jgi:hypothetical protein
MGVRRSVAGSSGGFSTTRGDDPSSLAAALRPFTRAIDRHRRLLAAVCAGAAVVVAVSALTPSAPAAFDAASAGRSSVLPVGAGDAAVAGADRVAVAVRLADAAGVLLLRPGSHAEVLAGPPADGGWSAAGSAGSAAAAGDAEVLASDAVVLAIPEPAGAAGGASSGAGVSGLLGSSSAATGGLDGVVVLAVPPSDARRLAAAAGTRALSVAVAVGSGG